MIKNDVIIRSMQCTHIDEQEPKYAPREKNSILNLLFLFIFCFLTPSDSNADIEQIMRDNNVDFYNNNEKLYTNMDINADISSPCLRGEENRYSDLCAQWKAADASADSAAWAKGTYFIAIGGLVVGALTLGSAVAAAWYARAAANHTKRSADITQASNELANNALILAERAWIVPKITFTKPVHADKLSLSIRITNKNIGRTPAVGVSTSIHLFRSEDPDDSKKRMASYIANEIDDHFDDGVIVLPGDSYNRDWFPSIDSKSDGDGGIYLVCIVYYNIINDNKRRYVGLSFLLDAEDSNGDSFYDLFREGDIVSPSKIILRAWSGGCAT